MRYTAALLLSCLFATSLLASRAAEHAAAGQSAMARNQVDAAVTAYAKAVELEPRNARYHFLLGSAYGRQAQQSGTLKQAMLARKTKAHFEKAVELDPTMVEARFALIDYYLIAPAVMGGSEEKALHEAGEIRKIDRLEGHRALGRIYTRQKKTDLAKKEYLEAVRTHPDSAKAHYLLGSFHMNEKNWGGALQSYDTALKLDPGYMVVYLRLGQLTAQSESNYQRGEEALRKYLSYKPKDDEPGHASSWYWLGMLQEKQGRNTDARQSYTNALRLLPDSKNIKEALKRVS
jgi:cytochrome c-type biogenesis protein CcmH/NrfG